MIRFDKLSLRYENGHEVLQDVSLQVLPHSMWFITGPSGAGKTTLMNLLFMQLRPSSGRLFLFGRDVTTLPHKEHAAFRRRIGIVHQEFQLIDHLSVYDNVALPFRIRGQSEDAYKDKVVQLLEWVGLGNQIFASPPSLSGGEKQRVAIARAVITKPDLLLADEPTGNVDPIMAKRLLHLFIELHNVGTTILIATHDLNLMDSFPAPRLVIEGGHVTAINIDELPQ